MYVFDKPNEPLANLSLLLKRFDCTVVLAAKSLGLTQGCLQTITCMGAF